MLENGEKIQGHLVMALLCSIYKPCFLIWKKNDIEERHKGQPVRPNKMCSFNILYLHFPNLKCCISETGLHWFDEAMCLVNNSQNQLTSIHQAASPRVQ